MAFNKKLAKNGFAVQKKIKIEILLKGSGNRNVHYIQNNINTKQMLYHTNELFLSLGSRTKKPIIISRFCGSISETYSRRLELLTKLP
jgi:hypothetical protein